MEVDRGMVFKRMLRAFGVGGPSVHTLLDGPQARPGSLLTGRVAVVGGDHAVDIEHVALGLVTRVRVESGDVDVDPTVELHRLAVAGAIRLAAGERREWPFTFPVPWESPVTDLYGQRLPGVTIGLRTELAVARTIDRGDVDEITVHPLPAQAAILDAFVRLGFRFSHADLRRGRIAGVAQTLPFYQEVEFWPPPAHVDLISQVELTFVADQSGVDVVLEFDKRGGLCVGSYDTYGRFRVGHTAVEQTDWVSVVDGWVRRSSERYADLVSR